MTRCKHCGAIITDDGGRYYLAFLLSDRWRALANSADCPASPNGAHERVMNASERMAYSHGYAAGAARWRERTGPNDEHAQDYERACRNGYVGTGLPWSVGYGRGRASVRKPLTTDDYRAVPRARQ